MTMVMGLSLIVEVSMSDHQKAGGPGEGARILNVMPKHNVNIKAKKVLKLIWIYLLKKTKVLRII